MKYIRFLTIIGLCCIIIQTVLAQPLNLVLDQPETGNQTHQAVLSITFANGYSYTPNGGSMTAEIINPAVGNISYQSEIDPNTYTINTSLPVGALNEEIQVTGNLNYSVGFELPKGAGDLMPSLGLNYMSNFSDGFLGAGFNLTGLTSIERVNKRIYHENTSAAIAGNQTDAYALDGKRLLLASGTYGAAGSVYGTEIEEFSKIVAVGSSGSNQGPQSFLIYTKSGLILEYGNTSDSRVLRSGTTVLTWKLNKITDRFNNSIVYSYYEYKDEKPVTLISYNGGISQIKFKYKHRADYKKYVYGGKEFTRDILLDNIEINNNGLLFKKYEFSYMLDNCSQLQKITETSSAGQQMNPTVFSWTKQIDALSQTTHYSNSTNERYFHGDFNGDGITDFVAIPDKTSYTTSDKFTLYIGSTSGTMVKKVEKYLKAGFKNFLQGDFNGDGKTDLLMITEESSVFKYTCFTSTGENFSETPTWFISHVGYKFYLPVDYNGDGKTELFIYKPKYDQSDFFEYKLYTATGTFIHDKSFIWEPDIFPQQYPLAPEKMFDFNGDGRTDIVSRTANGLMIYEFKTKLSASYIVPNFDNLTPIICGDFNGDGSDDFLKTSGPINPVWSIISYTQSGFQEKIISGMPNLNLHYNNNLYFCQDFNGDGKMDIITWGKGTDLGNSNKRIFIALNKGDGTEYNVSEYISSVTFDMPPEGIRPWFYFGDYNGDGRQQFFYKRGSTSKLHSFSSDTPSNLMKTIINGHGAKTSVVYMPMSKAGVYTKGSGAVYPVIDLGSSGQLVRTVLSDNGTASSTLINYSYTGAKVHLQGKGFLGFTKITAVNNASDVTTESNFSFDLTNFYPKITSVTKKKNSTLLSTDSYNWNKQTISGKRIFPFISRITKTNNLTGQSVYTDYSYYPTYGNLQKIKTFFNGTSHTKESVFTYGDERPTNYLVGRPTIVDETYVRDGSTITKKINRTFQTTSNAVLTEIHNTGDASAWTLTREYDEWGNVKKEIGSATGIASQTTEFFYNTSNGVTLEKVKDVNLGNETNYTWYPATGLLHEETDPFGNKVTYAYNNADQVSSITPSTGVTKTITRSYNVSGGPSLARFYIQETGTDNSAVKVWYDKVGKEIRNEIKGFSGSMIKTDKVYLGSGLLQKYSEPTTGTPSNWNNYYYSSTDNRPELFTPKYGPSETYSYSGAQVTKTVNSRQYKTTYNNDGTVASNEDPGGTVGFIYWPDGLLKSTSTPEGMTTDMTYDKNGNRLTIADPSAGTITNEWYGTGQVKKLTTGRNKQTTYYYQTDGLLDYSVTDGLTTDYAYNAKGQVSGITSPGGVSRSYGYNPKGQVTSVTETVGGVSNTVEFGYDTFGRLNKKTFNGDAYEQYYYQNGYLYRITFNGSTVWQATTIDEYSRIRAANIGATSASWSYNSATNLLSQIKGTGVQQYDYVFDGATGNLSSRTRGALTESFGYDTGHLDRLASVTGASAQTLTYQPGNKGNILTKSDAGTYSYDAEQKYAVNGITNAQNISATAQHINYTAFDKVATITEGTKTAEFVYNADRQRVRMVLKNNGTVTKTRWYFGGSCEREQVGSTVTQYIWIGGDAYTAVAVAKKTGSGSWMVYNIFRDHLGAITHLKNGGNPADEYSFDAWGRRRDKDTWSYTLDNEPALFADRGFTGHEFLADFNLYNMNGRMFDPVVARFLSPDPYITDPFSTQSYNRYSYCLNNPLKFTDPSGEFIFQLFAAWAGNYLIGVADNWINKDMTLNQAFKATPVVAGINFSSSNQTFSHPQVEAHNIAQQEMLLSQELDELIANQRGRGLFGTKYKLGPVGIGVNFEIAYPEWMPGFNNSIGYSLSLGFVADANDYLDFYITERTPLGDNISFSVSPEVFYVEGNKGLVYNRNIESSANDYGVGFGPYGISVSSDRDIIYRQWTITGLGGIGFDLSPGGRWKSHTKLYKIYRP